MEYSFLIFGLAALNFVISHFTCRKILRREGYKVHFIEFDFSTFGNMRKLMTEKKNYSIYFYWMLFSFITVFIVVIGLFIFL